MSVLVLSGIAVCAVLAWLVLCWIRTVPVVHAWNPESHDKMTSYALDVLKEEMKDPTLLGWVLQRYDSDDFLHGNLVLQLRRGSIDEDMNSDLIVSLEPTWRWLDKILSSGAKTVRPLGDFFFPVVSGLAKIGAFAILTASRNTPNQSVSEWIVRGIDTHIIKQWKDLDGTNGGYHFYNPVSRKGLSDPVQLAIYLQKAQDKGWIRGVSDPMPSARHRAFIPDTPQGWWMDREKRTYTQGDALRYYSAGCQHLGAYATGRVVHLLQDMAVPAHVRDDAHFGLEKTDPADPLEYFAAWEDWVGHFGEPVPSSEIVWGFDPGRTWTSAGRVHLAEGKVAYSGKKEAWVKGSSVTFESFFDELAGLTHATHYSYGTIPGNADSHNPDKTRDPDRKPSIPWVPDHPPDFLKCRPSIGALIEVFRLQGLIADKIHDHALFIRNTGFQFDGVERVEEGPKPAMKSRGDRAREFRESSGTPGVPSAGQDRRGAPQYRPHTRTSDEGKRIIDEWFELFKPLYPVCREIEALAQQYRGTAPENPSGILAGLIQHAEFIDTQLGRLKNVPLSTYLDGTAGNLKDENRERIREVKEDLDNLLVAFQTRQKNLRTDLLKECLKDPSVLSALTVWITRNPDRKGLAQAFAGTHGPCCLMNDREDSTRESDLPLMLKQYITCQSSAIAFTAAFLARWFETMYTPEYGKGVPIWKNKIVEKGRTSPELGADDPAGDPEISNGQEITVHDSVFALGVAQCLPVELDLELTVTYIGPPGPDGDDSFTRKFYGEGIPLQVNQFIVGDTGGSDGRATEVSIPFTRSPAEISLAALRPYCDSAVGKLPLPMKGGIPREQEQERLMSVVRSPGRQGGGTSGDGASITGSIVQFEFGEQPEQADVTPLRPGMPDTDIPDGVFVPEGKVWDPNRRTFLEK